MMMMMMMMMIMMIMMTFKNIKDDGEVKLKTNLQQGGQLTVGLGEESLFSTLPAPPASGEVLRHK